MGREAVARAQVFDCVCGGRGKPIGSHGREQQPYPIIARLAFLQDYAGLLCRSTSSPIAHPHSLAIAICIPSSPPGNMCPTSSNLSLLSIPAT